MSKDRVECHYYLLVFTHFGMSAKYPCSFFDRTNSPEARRDLKISDNAIDNILEEMDIDWRANYCGPDMPISKFVRSTLDRDIIIKQLTDLINNQEFVKLESLQKISIDWRNQIRHMAGWKYRHDPEAAKWFYAHSDGSFTTNG